MTTAFLLGFLGSWHCAAMCGGFAMAPRPLPYQAGRLLSYVAVGALLGWAGATATEWIGSKLVLGIAGALLLLMSWARVGSVETPVAAQNGFSLRSFLWLALGPWLRKPGAQSRFLLGTLTGTFPCGLLYAGWLQAAGTSSPLLGATSMAAFWLGTLPGLLLPGVLCGWMPRAWVPRVQAAAMAAAGLLMLWSALAAAPAGDCPACH